MAAKAGAESEMKKRKKETVFEGIMADRALAIVEYQDQASHLFFIGPRLGLVSSIP